MNCLYCGKDMIYNMMLRSDAHFCTPEHQIEYWKLRRKIDRQTKRALEAVIALNIVLQGNTSLALLAADSLTDIYLAASFVGAGITWKCRECGQTVFIRPGNRETCDYCGHEEWSVILPTVR